MAGIRGAIQRSFLERLSDKFTVGDGCWEWTGSLNDAGYGQIYSNKTRKPERGHRMLYELLVGPIPDGLTLDHLCRNRKCVRPDHLEPVTRGENVRRGAADRLTDICRNGHERTQENTYITPAGVRQCRTCKAQRAA